ncbi:DNA-binding protein RFX5 isoform X2 [Amia ocellicauda]|uniref:DNA-binding protein RFX5 isoform X2 n=1 Tax=Amia ocellicauda TaxID=2972642 RepID=UPI0034640ECE
MADDRPRSVSSKRGALAAGEGDTEPNMLVHKLKSSISKNIQAKVDSILQDVQRFSDSDKLYLYLQLPSGPSAGEKSSSDSSSFSTADQLHTCNWIRSHLEEHADTCLPKQDVYETYRRYCENLQYRTLSAANFGKIIRDIFPNIKARRLGGRGQSKYCYSGIRRKTVLNMPLLPNLDLKNDPSELTELVQTYKQEVTEAACELICDWAEKILKRSFDTVVEIARFLVQEHIVNPRCSQAELITSAALAGGPAKPHKGVKKSQPPPKGSGPEGEGNSPETKDKDSGDRAAPPKQSPGEKPAKGVEGGRPGGRDSQVEAVMKRFPQLLPRTPVPDKVQLPARSSPPALAPKERPGVKVTLPIAMTSLPQPQGTPLPVINMILPTGTVSFPYAEKERVPGVAAGAAPGPVPRPRPAAKRAQDMVGEAGLTPTKRKRGRPRKSRPEETGPLPHAQPPAATTATGGVIHKALPSVQPSVTTILEVMIQDHDVRVLGTLPPGLDPQVQPLQDTVDLTVPEEPKSQILQVYRPGMDSQGPLILHTGPELVRGDPAEQSQGWEASRAMVEVIRRVPQSREASACPEVQGEAFRLKQDSGSGGPCLELSLSPASQPQIVAVAQQPSPTPHASSSSS